MPVSLVLALAALLAASGCDRSEPRPAAPANLLLVTVDTLRADHLGVYGYPRDTSPNLDALARSGTWFPRVYSESATTGAAHASLFTSLPPSEHGVYANRERFPKDLASLMSVLRARGYATAAFVSSVVVGRKSGLQDQFEHFDDELTTVEPNRNTFYERPAVQTVAAVRAWLDRAGTGRPFFLWVHLIDPHGPYQAPVDPDRYVGDEFYARGDRTIPLGTSQWERGRIPSYQILDGRTDSSFYVARYDAEIRYADGALGTLFADLEGRGLGEDTLIAVTADHGETLAEEPRPRVFSHGTITYTETVHVPWIVREARGGRRLDAVARDRPLSSLDVAPTLLDLLGVESPPAFRGRNLLRDVLSPAATTFSFGAYGSERLEVQIGTQFAVRRWPFSLIVNLPGGSEELYDLRADPGEAENVVASAPPELEGLRRDLGAQLDARPRASRSGPLEEVAPSLKALGYVE